MNTLAEAIGGSFNELEAKISRLRRENAALQIDANFVKALFDIAADSRFSDELIGIRVRNELAHRATNANEQTAGSKT